MNVSPSHAGQVGRSSGRFDCSVVDYYYFEIAPITEEFSIQFLSGRFIIENKSTLRECNTMTTETNAARMPGAAELPEPTEVLGFSNNENSERISISSIDVRQSESPIDSCRNGDFRAHSSYGAENYEPVNEICEAARNVIRAWQISNCKSSRNPTTSSEMQCRIVMNDRLQNSESNSVGAPQRFHRPSRKAGKEVSSQ
jgi:hypothetical protein